MLAGELKRWHALTLTFDGPAADEADARNPFREYRLDVTFVHAPTGEMIRVPGYFAADGEAAETGATGGTKWRVHFVPPTTGAWTYRASFRQGADVATRAEAEAGTPASFDGATGSFTVAETDKSGRDLRAKGMLRYVGEHYLRFDGGEWFLKAGTDSPETLLAFADFDGTRVHGGTQTLKTYQAHLGDWRAGDPTWRGGKGKGLIGALNYLASEGMNVFSFLTMNVDGDGKNVWPWVAPDVRDRYDVSKLAQWERVFGHADSLGLYLHFKTQETENDLLLDGGNLGTERRLYYRELIARFGHHLALNWNLGEENDIWKVLDDRTQVRLKAYAEYIRELDPYDHHIVVHTHPGLQDQVGVYEPLLGPGTALTGVSLQTQLADVYEHTRRWVEASRSAGRKWVVANDEQGNANTGVTPDGVGNNHDAVRQHALWGNLMAGGAGVELYFGYQYPQNDLNAEDLRSRDAFWDQARHALGFFRDHLPFWEMTAQHPASQPGNYVFARPGEVYAVYSVRGGDTTLRLEGGQATYQVAWFDPRNGGALRAGSIGAVSAAASPAMVSIGSPPAADGRDWVALARRQRP
ncbi:MAG: DUF5060 domain-containing protein [Gemmatimonadetes bacterium]|nr:DUF5060 domain-containing protein [Gemmatimonadota bacterium]